MAVVNPVTGPRIAPADADFTVFAEWPNNALLVPRGSGSYDGLGRSGSLHGSLHNVP